MRRVDLDIFFSFFFLPSPVIEAKRETLGEHFSSPLPRANGNDNGGSVSQKFRRDFNRRKKTI